MKPLAKKLNIVLAANNKVGLEITKYLLNQKENISALVLHPKSNSKFSREIKNATSVNKIFYGDQINESKVIREISTLKPDLFISAWFGYVLKKEFIKIFPLGCINLHNSFLPYNRGKYPHVWAIYKNTPYGVTIHYIDENIDSGSILTQKRIPIFATDTAGTLYDRSINEIIKLFINFWPKYRLGKIKSKPQDKNSATHHYAKSIKMLDFIDLNKKYLGKELINLLRARSFPDRTYAYYTQNGKKLYIKAILSDKPNF